MKLMIDTLKQLLTVSPYDRLSASNFQHSPLFDNILMNSIRFLDAFPEKTNAEKNSFLRGFVKILPQFSDRVRQRKVLPTLNIETYIIDSTGIAWTCARYGTFTGVVTEYLCYNE